MKCEVRALPGMCDRHAGLYMVTGPTEGAITDTRVVHDAGHAREHDSDSVRPRGVATAPQRGLTDLAGHGHFDQVVDVPAKL